MTTRNMDLGAGGLNEVALQKNLHLTGEGVGTSGNWETTQRTSKCI